MSDIKIRRLQKEAEHDILSSAELANTALKTGLVVDIKHYNDLEKTLSKELKAFRYQVCLALDKIVHKFVMDNLETNRLVINLDDNLVPGEVWYSGKLYHSKEDYVQFHQGSLDSDEILEFKDREDWPLVEKCINFLIFLQNHDLSFYLYIKFKDIIKDSFSKDWVILSKNEINYGKIIKTWEEFFALQYNFPPRDQLP